MSTLYLVNRATDPDQLLPLLAAGDSVLLCGNAVLKRDLSWPCKVYQLAEDMQARGLQATVEQCSIGYPEFVGLAASHERVVAW